MDQALLLRAVDRVVGSVEVGDQYALEVLEQLLEEVALPSRAVQEDDLLGTGEHADVARAGLQLHLRFVDVQRRPGEDLIKQSPVAASVVACHQGLDHVNLGAAYGDS